MRAPVPGALLAGLVPAAVLRPQRITELESFLTPGLALSDVLGTWAMILFLVGAIAAALLFWAVNDRRTMGAARNTPGLNLANATLVALAIILALLSVRGFVSELASGRV